MERKKLIRISKDIVKEMTIEECYEQYKAMLVKFSKKYYHAYYDQEDMLSVCNIAFVKAYNKYDRLELCFSTLLGEYCKYSCYRIVDRVKVIQTESLDQEINTHNNEKEMNKYDVIPDTKDYFKDIENSILIKEMLESLNEEEKQILYLTLQRKKQSEIGEQLGITQVQVSRKLKKIGVKIAGDKDAVKGIKTTITPKLKKQMYEMFDKGMSAPTIAGILGCTRDTVYKHKRVYLKEKENNQEYAKCV